MNKIDNLTSSIKACRICLDHPDYLPPLPHEPRPIAWLSKYAKTAIAGQAPGLKVHQTGIPFNDPSGNRLRDWLGVSREAFYDLNNFAIVPMGFCFPGYDAKGSDLPPRRECASHWHEKIFKDMNQIELVLAIGQYAQKWHIKTDNYKNMTETVQNWQDIIQKKQPRGYHVLPLPHPSWRNTSWIKKNLWFEEELLPYLKAKIQRSLNN